jgi:hypothetical protein
MAGIRVRETSADTVAELAWFCVPPERREDPAFRIGARAKEVWIREKLANGEPVAKIAYLGAEAGGILHWVDRAQEPVAARKRGGYEGIVVNRRPLRSSVFDREEFAREVRTALGG